MAFLPVVLAGGRGSRLWPLSTPENPKQFLTLFGGRSLFQETLARLDGMDAADAIVICGKEHRLVAAEQARRIGCVHATFVIEPFGRNTAPAAALAALLVARERPDTALLILPSDHLIADAARFHKAIATAAPLAADGGIVAFGIPPDRAEAGYGYIRRGRPLSGGAAFAIDGFVEKPDVATARRLLDEGGHDWNSGMFMVRADRYIDELHRHRPDILDACLRTTASARPAAGFVDMDPSAFETCAAVSIDHAIMEKTDAGAVVPLDAGWDDLGSWPSLLRALPTPSKP